MLGILSAALCFSTACSRHPCFIGFDFRNRLTKMRCHAWRVLPLFNVAKQNVQGPALMKAPRAKIVDNENECNTDGALIHLFEKKCNGKI